MRVSQDFKSSRPCLQQAVNAPSAFRIDSRVAGDAIHVVVSGELDIATDHALRDALTAAMPHRVDLDLSGISFIGCTALTVLLQAATKRAKCGAAVSIYDASDAVRRLVDIAGVQHLLTRLPA